MSGERVAAMCVLGALALGMVVVGRLGARGSIRFALGGHADDGPVQPAAQRAIGRWFIIGGAAAGAAAVVAALGPAAWVGPAVVAGAIAVAVSGTVALAAGVRHLE